MPDQLNYQVGSITAGVRFDNFGRAIRTTVIKYTVGQDGPFTLTVDAGQDSPDQVQAALTAAAGKIAAIRAGS